MNDYAIDLVRRYRSRGVLVDANLLLLLSIGSFNQSLVGRFKRTERYTVEDYVVLTKFLSFFDCLVTTPNILTEVSSLSGQLGEPAKKSYFANFAANIKSLEEKHVASVEAAALTYFSKFGLTDSVIAHLSKGKYLVLTDDFPLYGFLVQTGYDVINFNHLRPYR